jgi:hypothetical protein
MRWPGLVPGHFFIRHCEERRDAAIQFYVPLDCFAALAMTI